MTLPTLWLSNGSSHRTPGRHGPGRKWHAMAKPRDFETAQGRVTVLVPPRTALSLLDELLEQRRAFGCTDPELVERYHALYDQHLVTFADMLPPRALRALAHVRHELTEVQDGDTICCACSADHARAGECHLAFAAPHLVRAGWRVIFHGDEFDAV